MPDVLIHNMELPEKDGLLSINIWPNGSVTIAMDLECKPVARAVELPQHGDLIDRDAFLRWLDMQNRMWVRSYTTNDLREMLRKGIPTIIPATEEVE